jgi:methionyl-tRNA synthetase
MPKPKFYLTTPLYYVNDVPHIGHAYTTIAADALARYKRLAGFDVFLLTGTDEHGQKVLQAARAANMSPKELANRIVIVYERLWEKLNISYDDFIRTTEPRHERAVIALFNKLYANGDIYKGTYEGWYCTPCETFCSSSQLKVAIGGRRISPLAKSRPLGADGVDGADGADEPRQGREARCPECGREVEKVDEENYFFKMSRYQDQLLEHIEANPDFIKPPSRRNEIVNFVKEGLRDISISRMGLKWGIPAPVDPAHAIYVWVDALTNYISAIGYSMDSEKFNKLWPADLHIVGKDIMKFHAIVWPTILIAAGLDPPKCIFGHGWWTVEGQKMSKSLGNVVDPNQVADEFGVDAFRYFLLRHVPFGLDGDFSRDALIQRVNADLANDLGNLLNRTLHMVTRYFDGLVPTPFQGRKEDRDLQAMLPTILSELGEHMNNLRFSEALEVVWRLVRDTNKYLDSTKPWIIAKDMKKKPRLGTVLYNSLEAIRIISILIFPFMPNSAGRIWKQLGVSEDLERQSLVRAKEWGILSPGTKIGKVEPVFPRIEH